MGIRVFCPKGHKLHVKAFLAGKRAICPKCGSKFEIPAKEMPPDDERQARSDAGEVPDALAESASVASGRSEQAGAAVPVGRTEESTTAVAETAPPAPPPPKQKPSDDDLFNEAPDAIWYVRHPTAGQFGPAKGDIARRWLSEGRITSDSLVWREGWPEWKRAGETFPCLAQDERIEFAIDLVPKAKANLLGTAAKVPMTAERRKGRQRAMLVTIGLSVVLVILLIVLLVLLLRSP